MANSGMKSRKRVDSRYIFTIKQILFLRNRMVNLKQAYSRFLFIQEKRRSFEKKYTFPSDGISESEAFQYFCTESFTQSLSENKR